MDTVLHIVLSKVHEKSKVLVHQLHICLDLLKKHRFHFFYRLQLYDNLVVHQDVEAKVSL